jgi:hypothetical protein
MVVLSTPSPQMRPHGSVGGANVQLTVRSDLGACGGVGVRDTATPVDQIACDVVVGSAPAQAIADATARRARTEVMTAAAEAKPVAA